MVKGLMTGKDVEGVGRGLLEDYPSIYLERLGNTKKTISQYS
jgi:hypothetical protein